MADYFSDFFSEGMKLKKMQLDKREKDLEERERKFKEKEQAQAGQQQEEAPQDAKFDFNFTRLR